MSARVERVLFTEEMKKDYTILIPTMLPMHFKIIQAVFRQYGYNAVLLENMGDEVKQCGLRYVHNDTCYPALLVIGQFIDALQKGGYDPNKVALMITQTGGGCRASNYISLIRKALAKAGFDYVPVISFSLHGIEKHPGFKLSVKLLHGMMYAILYADLLMSLNNQVRPYEINKGESEKLCAQWTKKLGHELGTQRISYKKIKKNYAEIVKSFAAIPIKKEDRVKVGVVGEIFVKYSPLANNDLERFLISEGAEVVVPGLYDFCLFFVYNYMMEPKLYRKKVYLYPLWKILYKFLCNKKEDLSRAIRAHSNFDTATPFDHVAHMAEDLIHHAVKMGEGWLLTAEMVELAESGCGNIVCTQPFGCLPNHICGKGMMKPIKELKPDVNIVAIDYDAGASRVNQENRLKLMLANAKKLKAEQKN